MEFVLVRWIDCDAIFGYGWSGKFGSWVESYPSRVKHSGSLCEGGAWVATMLGILVLWIRWKNTPTSSITCS